VGLGGGGDFDQLVAGGEDGDAWLPEDIDLRGADRGEGGDVAGGEARAGGDERVAATGFTAGGDDVAAGADFAAFAEPDAAVGNLDVFEHDDGIGACGDGCAGHDLERGAGGERLCGAWLAGAEDAGDGEPIAGGKCSTLDGIAIARGAMEGWEIAVGGDGPGEDAMEGFEERDLVGAGCGCGGEAVALFLCSFKDESGGFGVGEDGGHVDFILRSEGG
jgi:hypothetical protein